MKKPEYTGWYDGAPRSQGNTVLCYWNHVVNTYAGIGNDENDPRRYTADHYIESLQRMMSSFLAMDENKKFIVDLPMAEVWRDENDHPIFIGNDFIQKIVQAFHEHPSVIGWYAADEPELWGQINSWPKITIDRLVSRYKAIKEHSDKPVIVVFCDPDYTMNLKYSADLWSNKYRCFDVYGFDFYPYRTQRDIALYPKMCKKSVIQRMIDAGSPRLPIMFVGQASGTDEFGTRNPSLEEMAELYKEWTNRTAPSRRWGFFLWSWSYSSTQQKQYGDFLLNPNILQEHTSVQTGWVKETPSFWRRLYCKFFG